MWMQTQRFAWPRSPEHEASRRHPIDTKRNRPHTLTATFITTYGTWARNFDVIALYFR